MGPDYGKIASLLSSSSVFNSVSELHGVISGQVCAGAAKVKTQLTQELLCVEEAFPSVIDQLVQRLGKDISEQMQSGDFSFQPLLPEDEEELSHRLHALGEWCENFNLGFGASFGKGDKSMLEETREVLKDFAAIAEIEDSTEDEQGIEQNEEDYMEIVEYVRMAAATVFAQSNAETMTGSSDESKTNIH